jgi:hypothetical protein
MVDRWASFGCWSDSGGGINFSGHHFSLIRKSDPIHQASISREPFPNVDCFSGPAIKRRFTANTCNRASSLDHRRAWHRLNHSYERHTARGLQRLLGQVGLHGYQFSVPWLEIEVAKGWMPLFAQLCADVDQALGADTYGFYWSQIKEKFGSARFYYRFEEPEPVPSDYCPDRDRSRNYLLKRGKFTQKLVDSQIIRHCSHPLQIRLTICEVNRQRDSPEGSWAVLQKIRRSSMSMPGIIESSRRRSSTIQFSTWRRFRCRW